MVRRVHLRCIHPGPVLHHIPRTASYIYTVTPILHHTPRTPHHTFTPYIPYCTVYLVGTAPYIYVIHILAYRQDRKHRIKSIYSL